MTSLCQLEEEEEVLTEERANQLYSEINLESYSEDDDTPSSIILMEEEVDVVEYTILPNQLVSLYDVDEEGSDIFSPLFSDPLLCCNKQTYQPPILPQPHQSGSSLRLDKLIKINQCYF